MSQKPDDWNTVSCCKDHHTQQHAVGERSFETLYRINLSALADEFAKASPKAAEIRNEKVDREEMAHG
jgi:hypothetical protein